MAATEDRENTGRSYISLRLIALILILAAVSISGYLAYTEFAGGEIVCAESGSFDCAGVQASRYSKLAGIPVAYLGLATNLLLLALVGLEARIPFLEENGPVLTFGIVLFASLFSLWLIVVQAALLRSYCIWCLGHEALVFALLGVSIVRLRNAGAEER
jgi:uncharacterized membrane protein